jgi:hypothetical protein
MNLKTILVLGLALILGIFWGPTAWASSINITSIPTISITGDIPGAYADHSDFSCGSFFIEATSPGPFDQNGHGGSAWESIQWTTHATWSEPGPASYPCSGTGSSLFTFELTQEGSLRFTAVSIKGTLHNYLDGSDTNLFQVEADAEQIENGGTITFGTSFDLGITEMANTWIYNMIDPDHPEIGGWWTGEGSVGGAFDINLEISGNVVDATAPVPLPPTLLLLGSGLGGLVIYGRKKLMSCGK